MFDDTIFKAPNAKENITFNDVVQKYIPLASKLRVVNSVFVNATGTATSAGSGPNGWYTTQDLDNLGIVSWASQPYNWVEVRNANKVPEGVQVAGSLAALTDQSQAPETRVLNYFERGGFVTGDPIAAAYGAALAIPSVRETLNKELSV